VSAPPFAISQITTLTASFEDDLRAYRDAGAEGIGIWEIKLPEGGEEAAAEALETSGLASTAAVPAVASIGSWPIGGPGDPRERVDAYRAGLRRLAPFRPTAVVLLTGAADREVIASGLRAIAAEAHALGLKIALEPYSRFEGEQWSIVHTIRDAVGLIEEADAAEDVGILFDVWHLWDDPGVEDDIAAHIDRIAGVHVCDWREPTRGFADRVLPGDGVADVPRLLAALDRAGWDGFYELEIFSDNGAFGSAYSDSLWDVPPDELARRGREAFLACWERRG
jgi:sugar phosphate isomerase/epimerase